MIRDVFSAFLFVFAAAVGTTAVLLLRCARVLATASREVVR
jgi:hypothetical protein